MTREEFISKLNEKIKDYNDHNDIVSYYFELISDKMDSGMSEEDAVASLGDIDTIVKNIEESKDELKDDTKDIVVVEAKKEEKTEDNINTNEAKSN